jgi:xanthine dehydrogenase molybdopterin-binding subunit B
MSRENFIKRMQLIQNLHSQQDTVSRLIESFSDGYCVVSIGNELVEEIIDMITEDFGLEDKELLYRWLYDEDDKVIYIGQHGEEMISLRTLDELYDYIIS